MLTGQPSVCVMGSQQAALVVCFNFGAAKARVLPGQAKECGLRFSIDFSGKYQTATFVFAHLKLCPGNEIARR